MAMFWKKHLHEDDLSVGEPRNSHVALSVVPGHGAAADSRQRMDRDSRVALSVVDGVDSDADGRQRLELLDRYLGIGLWDAVLHEADPASPQSQWTWSAEFRRLLGFRDEAEFPNVMGSWSDRLHPEDVDPTFKAFGACLNDKSGRTGYDVTYRLKSKSGAYRWFRAIGGVARDKSGQAMRACGSLIDIEAQIAAQQEKQRHLAESFETSVMSAVEVVSASATDIQGTASDMSRTADHATAQATSASEAAARAKANVEAIAAATEELVASIADTAQHVVEAARITAHASEENSRTQSFVQALASAADHIGDVVEVIKGVAEQTNLLALNAAIEAARAGEQGRGFAVVADEVRKLAGKTTTATVDIRRQVESLQAETKAAVSAIKNIGQVIEKLQGISSHIAAAAEKQSAGTEGIAASVQSAARDTQQVSHDIDGVAEAIKTTGSAAGQVQTSVGVLDQNAERLQTEVRQFLLFVKGEQD